MVSLNAEQENEFKQKEPKSSLATKSIGYFLTALISGQIGYEGLALIEMSGVYLNFVHILY